MNYKALVLSVVIGACFLELAAMKKVTPKKPSADISRAYSRVTRSERRAIEALVELGNAKEKPEIPPAPKKKAPKKTN
jgi:hypothetical protein